MLRKTNVILGLIFICLCCLKFLNSGRCVWSLKTEFTNGDEGCCSLKPCRGFTLSSEGGGGKEREGDVAEGVRVLRAENFRVNYKVERNDRQFAA